MVRKLSQRMSVVVLATACCAWALADPPAASPPQHEDAGLSEIMKIRRQVDSPLQGTVLDGEADGEADFRTALRDVRAGSPRRERSSPNEEWSPDDELISSLQTTADQLYHKANGFEEAKQYRRADRLRRLARALRREANLLDSSQSTGAQ